MRNPIDVLNSLSDKSKNLTYRFERLYRNLYNPEFYLLAYKNIYANKGSMTPGVNGITIDGMSSQRISKLIESLKDRSYCPSPARRTYIAKKSNPAKKRPLGIPSGDDKLVQEVVRMILESIYEPTFSDASHGFRPKKSCHTALAKIQKTFTGAKWFVEGDIKACFDSFDHHVLIDILRKRINDEAFIDLMWKFLKAGYMEQWQYHMTYSGTPQGSGISPIFANIYLNELDRYMEEYKAKVNTMIRTVNPAHRNMASRIFHYKAKNDAIWDSLSAEEQKQRAKTLRQMQAEQRSLPTHPVQEISYKALQYVRYADDFIVGVIGNRKDAETLKQDLTIFLKEKLGLTLSAEKTKITNTAQCARFLGYDIFVSRSQDIKRLKNGKRQRVYSGVVKLRMPHEKWTAKLLEYPAKKGYDFLGWATDPNATEPQYVENGDNNTFVIEKNLNLYAIWNTSHCTVTFESNGGSPVDAQTVQPDNVSAEPTAPTKEGYTFAGWFSDSGLTTAYSFGTAVNADITLYAKWMPDTNTSYKVERYHQNTGGNGYTLFETQDLQGTTAATVTAAAKSYTGFHENTNAAGRVTSGSVAPDGSLVLKLYYDRETYAVTYESNGGMTVPAQSGIRFGSPVVEPAAPAKEGYTFAGWFSDSSLTTAYNFGTAVNADITLYAKWTPDTNTSYKVEHYHQNAVGDGYTLLETEDLQGTTDATVTAAAKTYTGFQENTSAAGRVASGSVAPDGSLVLKLYYDRETYAVTYESNGGTTVPAQSGVRFGSPVVEPAAPAKEGYTFAGWFSDSSLTTAYSFGTAVNADITLYAKWIPDTNTSYKVEHYHQNTEGDGYTLFETEDLQGTTGATVTAVAKTYTGFHKNTSAVGRVASGSVAPDGSLVLKLYYDRETYTVTFDSNGGNTVPSQNGLCYGDLVVEPIEPKRTGYVFAGWYSNPQLSSSYRMDAPITEDLSLYAKWMPDTDTSYRVEHYQQTVEGDGYTLFETVDLQAPTDAAVTATAKTYTGFHENISAVDRVASSSVAADGSLVLKLYYDRDTYTVTFESNGGSTIPAQENVRFGGSVVQPSTPLRIGCTFAGWYTDSSLTTSYSFSSRVEHDLTLYAKWILNDGTVDGVVENSDGDPIPGAKITVRAGNVDYKTTTTDNAGRFTVLDVKYGIYNLVAEKDGVIVTKIIQIQQKSTSSMISLPEVKTNSVVEVLEETPQIVVGGLDTLYASDEIFTESDNAVVASGGSVELSMSLESKKETELGEDGAKLSILPPDTNALYLDIQLTKTIVQSDGETASTALTELPQSLEIYIPVENGEVQSCKVFRIHNGVTEEIEKEPNVDDEFFEVQDSTVVVHANKFSTYAISTPSGNAHVNTSSSRYSITASAGAGGMVTPESASVSSGESKTIQIIPDEGHAILSVTVDGQKVDTVGSYTFDNVHRDHKLTVTFLCPSLAYDDLDTGSWYHTAVDVMLSKGYMFGTSGTRWEPNGLMTRAQMAAILARVEGEETENTIETRFQDVDRNAWYAEPVNWAAAHQVGLGYGSNMFGPNDTLTREQFALMLYRYAGEPDSQAVDLSEFFDWSHISPWAQDAVLWAVNAGILQGNEQKLLSPQGTCTRAQAATIMYRFLKGNE